MKKDKVIALIVVIVCLIPIIIIVSSMKSSSTKRVSQTNKVDKEQSKLSKYDYGVMAFKDEKYNSAIANFKDVENTDSLYADAQEYIVLCEKKIIEQDKKESVLAKKKEQEDKKYEQQKAKLKNKYEKLMKSGLYKYQIEQRLQRDGFTLTQSKFESAPDGSTNVKSYYTGYFDGTSVRIWLQSGYSLGTYYSDVEVGY